MHRVGRTAESEYGGVSMPRVIAEQPACSAGAGGWSGPSAQDHQAGSSTASRGECGFS
jgi:hypothetical protein